MRLRLFFKEFKISNYCKATFEGDKCVPAKKTPREEAHAFAEVFYTPRGWALEITSTNDSPYVAWDLKHYNKLHGIDDDYPEGIIREKNFKTPRAAQQWITKRLKSCGWEPEDDWHY